MSRWTAPSDYDYAEEIGDPVERQQRSAKRKPYYETCAIPKGEPLKKTRRRAKRQDTKALKAWRDAAWKQQPGGDDSAQWGKCADCECIIFRSGGGFRLGHVHHTRSRRHKETRTAASNAEILCRKCHNERHGREF